MILFSVLLPLVLSIPEGTASEISCERVTDATWGANIPQSIKQCHVSSTAIDNGNTTFASSSDKAVQAIAYWSNKKVTHLPIAVSDSFPQLIAIGAGECSIAIISKDNFRSLKNLKYLCLRNNQIENIPNDTFEDLTLLEQLELCEYKINLNVLTHYHRNFCLSRQKQNKKP